MLVAVVTGAVGTAMVIYGIRQKEPVPLVFGIVIGVIPIVLTSPLTATAASLAAGGLFLFVR